MIYAMNERYRLLVPSCCDVKKTDRMQAPVTGMKINLRTQLILLYIKCHAGPRQACPVLDTGFTPYSIRGHPDPSPRRKPGLDLIIYCCRSNKLPRQPTGTNLTDIRDQTELPL